ncbi:MAG: NAD(P)/FAD-dependent oxidoreductase [Hyphomicrobiales bacterium]|nr:NAD(P)/FAD-dependent oxidoreductase [Hyphomicrobiales bacterium]
MSQINDAYAKIPETRSSDDHSLHRIVIVGGGAGGLELATTLGRKLGRRNKASVTLLDKSRVHVWKPLLHEVASGSFDPETEAVELMAHARAYHYRYRIGAMEGLNREKRQIYVRGSLDENGVEVIPPRVIGYDTLVIAVGSITADFGIPGVIQHSIPLESADDAARFNRRMINACLRANAQYEPLRPGQLHCVIVGGGATGVELSAELHKSMRDLASYGLDNIDFDMLIRITLIEAGPRILPALPEDMATNTLGVLEGLGVAVRTDTRVVEVRADGVLLQSGEFVASELIVWSAGFKAPDFLRYLDGLETDRINRLVVRETLQTTRDDNIFAMGDCASFTPRGETEPLGARAQWAHQQATLLARSIPAKIAGKPLSAYKPKDYGSLVALSDYKTLGNLLGRFRLEGLIARLMYKSLYRMHQQAVLGTFSTIGQWIAGQFRGQSEPRVKLH